MRNQFFIRDFVHVVSPRIRSHWSSAQLVAKEQGKYNIMMNELLRHEKHGWTGGRYFGFLEEFHSFTSFIKHTENVRLDWRRGCRKWAYSACSDLAACGGKATWGFFREKNTLNYLFTPFRSGPHILAHPQVGSSDEKVPAPPWKTWIHSKGLPLRPPKDTS